MARTDVDWVNYQGRYIYPNHPTWFDLLIKWTSKYINFNTISWSTWYWIRDNAWAIEFKDSWWSWNGMFIDSFTEWSIPFAGSDWQLTESNATLFRETTWEIGIGTNSLTANDMLTIKALTDWGSWNILIWQNDLWDEQFRFTDQGMLGLWTSPTAQLELTKSIELVNTEALDQWIIYKNWNRFIHNFSHPTGDTAKPDWNNVFLWENAGNFTMWSSATSYIYASYNIGIGKNVMKNNTTWYWNLACWYLAMEKNTTGYHNMAFGYIALWSNTTGRQNAAIWAATLINNITGSQNTASWYSSMRYNVSGSWNCAFWLNSLKNSTSWYYNVAIGNWSLYSLLDTSWNTALGYNSWRYIASWASNTGSVYCLYLWDDTRAGVASSTNEIVIWHSAIWNGSNTITFWSDAITNTYLRWVVNIKAWTNWGAWNILLWQDSLWAEKFEVTDQGTVSQEWWTIKPIKTITASTYTIPLSDSTILLDGTSNAVTATLPTAVWNTWQIFSIKCINIDYVCKLATNWTETIDWASDIEFVLYESKKIQSNGANRFIL